jgi:hypothetical protein
MFTPFRLLAYSLIGIGMAGWARAAENITLTMTPVGGSQVAGSQLVTIEVFITASSQDQNLRGAQVDLPCSLPGGSSGTITTGNADSDPATAVMINSTSQSGVPFMFPGGLTPTNQVNCRAAGTTPIGDPNPARLAAGQTRYLASIVYRVSACATGEFNVLFESRSEPPQSIDQTRLIAPDGPDPDVLDDVVAFKAGGASLSVETGRCCQGSVCLGEMSQFCCLNVNQATQWDLGTTCDLDCPPCTEDDDCDDNNECTLDFCRKGICEYQDIQSACDDGLFCTAGDVCSGGRCVGKDTPCPGERCDEERDACVECVLDADCDDGFFCNGAERCLPTGVCTAGPAPCPMGKICDEDANECLSCNSNADCGDGDPCTTDRCQEGGCVHTPVADGSPCNDLLFCTRIDACFGGVCVGSGDPCPAGRTCHEDRNTCVECLLDADCDDDNPCTTEGCDASAAVCFRGSNTDPCDDGLFCTVDDRCKDGVCTGLPRPCAGGAPCNEATMQCAQCADDADCDDANPCTADSCLLGVCRNEPGSSGKACDDGLFCTKTSACRDGHCVGLGAPCPVGSRCDEIEDLCVPAPVTLSLIPLGDDSAGGNEYVTVEVFITVHTGPRSFRGIQIDVPCSLFGGLDGSITTGSADGDPMSAISVNRDGSMGGVPFAFPGGLAPVNQTFCRVAATIAVGGSPVELQPGETRYLATIVYAVSECAAGEFGLVFEGYSNPPLSSDPTRVVSPDGSDPDLIDDVVAFAVSTAVLSVETGQCCRLGECVGQLNEACCQMVAEGDWNPDATCEDGCSCVEDEDCDDRNACTADSCDDQACVYSPLSGTCDDGLFCTAVDVCQGGECIGSGDACPAKTAPFCDELLDRCVGCLRHGDCEDGNPCTTDRCNALTGACVFQNNSKPCDDGLYCTKPDRCVNGACLGVGRRCPGRECDEINDRCLPGGP